MSKHFITSFSGSYVFLSNFYPHAIEYEEIRYPTSEHAFQAAKTLGVWQRKTIAALPTPGQAKRMGRQIELRPMWDSVKIQVMEEILHLKFEDAELRQMLMDTHPKCLVEGNTWGDLFWGFDTTAGRGSNNLGILLMRIRQEFLRD